MADILAALCVIEMVPGRRIVVGAVSSLPAKCLIVNSMQGNCRLSKGDKTLLATSQSMQLTYFLFLLASGGLRFDRITYTMIQQRPRIIVGVAGFEPRNSAPEIWYATNEPYTSLPMDTTSMGGDVVANWMSLTCW